MNGKFCSTFPPLPKASGLSLNLVLQNAKEEVLKKNNYYTTIIVIVGERQK